MKHFRILFVAFAFLLTSQSCSLNTEVVKLHSVALNENIYLRYFAESESSVISLNHFALDTCSDIIIGNTGVFFYKFVNDSLMLHSYNVHLPTNENIRTNYKITIKYQEMENGNADFVDFATVYKKKGYKFFPPSLEYIVHNN